MEDNQTKSTLGRSILWLVVLAVIIVGGFALSKQKESEAIKIGVLSILSGDGAAWGESAKKGFDLAAEEYNNQAVRSGERRIDLVYENTNGETKLAVTGYKKLVKIDKVFAVLGPLFQTEVAAIAPLVEKDALPVITPSYAPIQNRQNPRNPLMVWMDPTIEASRMAQYVFSQGVHRIAVLGTKDSWENEVSDAFASAFTEIGGSITAKEIVQADVNDVKLSITKLISGKPEAVFLGTYYQFINGLKTLKDFQYKGKIYGIEVDSYLAGETKPRSDGLEFIAPDFYTSEFMEKFQNRYGEKPGIPAGQAYDAANILFSFIRKEKTADTIISEMREMRSYDGVSGLIEFTDDNKTLFPTTLFVVQDGTVKKSAQQDETAPATKSSQ